jgi:hypothetical protein
MSEFLDQIDVISIVFLIILLAGQSASFVFWMKFELKQLRKDSEMGDKNIEDKREANVAALKVIYDLKIKDSRSYAKGLFESQNQEIIAINKRFDGVDKTLEKILGILMEK